MAPFKLIKKWPNQLLSKLAAKRVRYNRAGNGFTFQIFGTITVAGLKESQRDLKKVKETTCLTLVSIGLVPDKKSSKSDH